MASQSDSINYYVYSPNKAAPIVFAVLFLISGCLHVWQNVLKYRSWRIGFLLPWAAAIFVAGFALREYGAYHTDDLPIFIASTVLLFVAPPVYNGANYFIFGRALYYLPYLSPIHPGRVWSTFITLDTIVGIITGNGASRAANSSLTPSQRNVGFVLIKVSLFMLLGMFAGFFSLNVMFEYRARKRGVFNKNMKVVMYTLYASNLLILLRNTFRVAVTFYSYDAAVNRNEWPIWVFEFAPMLINTYLMNVFPPARYLPANHKIYLAMDGQTEIEGPGMIDKRPFILTLVDPFDIVGIVTKKDRKNRYWLTDGIGGTRVEKVNEVAPSKA